MVAGAVGLTVGSFLNVCTLCWPQDESVGFPGSHCPSCGVDIRWYHNIPVLSFLLLRGRCRACKEPISIQYPLVELGTGLVWAGVFAHGGLSGEALRGAVFLTLLFGISLSDARFYIIPNPFSVGGLIVGMILAFLPGGPTALQALLGAALGFALLWGLAAGAKWMLGRGAIGGGDVKMMAAVGAYLGPSGVVPTIFLGALLGSVIFGPISYKTGKLVPFGTFLAAGAAVTYGWGDAMVAWYFTSILRLPPP